MGKGLSGGKLVIYPSHKARFKAGTTSSWQCMYGATSGELFIRGRAASAAVRNSGVNTVVEGLRRSWLRIHDWWSWIVLAAPVATSAPVCPVVWHVLR
jgi:glutamate synthase domain-containing protein 3